MLIPIGFFGGAVDTGAFDLLATSVLTSTATSVTFDVSTYASTYKHLQIRWVARSSQAQEYAGMALTLNSDTASNYSNHFLKGDGASVSSGAPSYVSGIGTQANQLELPGASIVSGAFGAGIYDILDAFNTSKYKTIRHFGGRGAVNTGDKQLLLISGSWRNTAAITGLTLTSNGNLVTGSRFSLYGIKG